MTFLPWMASIPSWNSKPITLLSYMDSIVNFGVEPENKKKTRELAQYSRETIFNFDYPLSTHVVRADFECQILNHYIGRRLGFDTPTAFEIALENKLNEIMPDYNKLFDMLDGWNVFTDGETISRTQSTSNSLSNTADATSNSTSDRRFSDMPQNQLSNVRDGQYVTDYNYDTNAAATHDASSSSGTGSLTETISRSPSDKIRVYTEFKKNLAHIMSMIYKELDVLFYGLI